MCFHNTFYHSTIFKTITDDLGNLKLSINSGIKNLFDGSFFKKQSILSKNDIDALKAYNAEIERGVSPVTAYYRTMQEASDAAVNMAQSAGDATVNLEQIPKVSKAGQVALSALATVGNMLVSMGISLAIQGVITGISRLSTASSDIADKAQEIGQAYKSTQSEISDYKTKIQELHDTINSSSSSIEDIATARQNLMSIQNEMIEKYGNEKDVIDMVTDAVNNQSDAFDRLSENTYQESVNKFNESDFWGDMSNYFDGYDDNFARMIDTMENYSIQLSIPRESKDIFGGITDDSERFMERLNNEFGDTGITTGSLQEVYDRLLKIQEIAKEYDLSEGWTKSLTDLSNSAKESLDKYSDIYDNYVLYEKILSKSGSKNGYDKSFENINDAMEDYKDAKLDGDDKKVRQAGEAYARIMSEELEKISPDDKSVKNYLQNLYPEMQEIVGKWNLQYDLEAKPDNDKKLKEALGKFSGTNEIKEYDDSTSNDSEKNKAYAFLEDYADKYHLTIDQLIEKAQELGYIQSEQYNNLVKQFGEKNVKKLSDEELEIAYKIKNTGNITFEELQQKIEDEKKKAEESTPKTFSEVWKGLKKETKDALLELAKSGELTAKTFKETEGADDFLKEIKMSATKAKTEVQNLLTVQEKLSAFSKGMGSLETAYNEFKDNKFVSAETLASLPDAYKSLKEFDLFSKIAGDPTNGKEKIKKAFDEIVTAYIKDQNTLVGVTEKNKNAVIANLKKDGVTNARKVVNSYIKSVNETKDLIIAAENELNAKSQKERQRDLNNFQQALKDKDTSFADACKVLGDNNAALMTSLGKNYADDYINWCKLCEEKVKAYNEMVNAINQAGDASTIGNPLVVDQAKAFKQKYKMTPQQYIKKYGNINSLVNSVNSMYKSGDADNVAAVVSEARAIINSKKTSNREKNAAKKLTKYAKAHLNFNSSSYKPKSSSTKKDKNKTKASTQEIDWIDRRLTSINNKLSLIKAQYENIASSVKGSNIDTIVNKQNKNLSTQITLLNRLYATSTRAASKYSKKASKIKISNNKKTDKKLKNLVKSEAAIGKKTSYKTLVKKYGQSTADKISNYRDYYDKARSSKQSAQEYKQQINQAKIQKQQNLADKYQSYIDKYTSRSEVNNKAGVKDNDLTLQHSAKEKENSIKKQISYTNKLYTAQKEIAKLEGNNQKVAQLEAERRKSIVDLQIQSLQNYADEYEATYNLKQTQASMTTDYKTKNALSKQSLTSLKSQYNTLIKIAKKQGDIVEASRLNFEYQQKVSEELKQRILNVSEDYDNRLIGNNRQMQVWENAASLAEAKGKTVNSGFYKNMSQIANEEVRRREEEYASARQEYENILKEDPDFINKPQWYDTVKELNEMENGLEQARINAAKLEQQAIKADWAIAESAQNAIDNLNSEAETYKTIFGYKDMFDKDGVITDAGTATLALDVYEIGNHITKIQKFNEEMNKLNKLYGEGKISVEEYDAQMKVLRDGVADSTSEIYSLRDAMKSLIEEGLNAELDALNKMIDKIKENLSDASNLREYQKNIEKQTKNIASLERQIMAKGGDTSEQGRATVQKLKAQLEEAQSNLEDTEYDKYIQDQERILDDLSDDFQDYLDAQLDQIDSLLNGIIQSIQDGNIKFNEAINQIGKTIGVDLSTALSESLKLFSSTGKNNSNDVYDNTVDAYNNSANDEYNTAQNTPVIDTYNKSGAFEQQAIKQAEEQKVKEQKAREDRKKDNNALLTNIVKAFSKSRQPKKTSEYQTSNILKYGSQQFTANIEGNKKLLPSTQAKNIDGWMKKLKDVDTGKALYNTSNADNIFKALNSLNKKQKNVLSKAAKNSKEYSFTGFANGGVVDGNSYYGDKLLARINSGESVLTKEFTDMLPNTVDIMKGFTDLYQQPDLSKHINTSPSQQNVNVGEVNVVLEGSNVTDFDSFAHTLQHSPKARNILQDVFTSGLTGDSNAYMRR